MTAEELSRMRLEEAAEMGARWAIRKLARLEQEEMSRENEEA